MPADLAPFLALRRHVGIAHHVPGRIRLKLDPRALAALPRLDPAPLVALLDRLPAVRVTRVNPAALSIVIDYDAAALSMTEWPRLLFGDPAEVDSILAGHLRPAAQP